MVAVRLMDLDLAAKTDTRACKKKEFATVYEAREGGGGGPVRRVSCFVAQS